jgi:hypothetical protein
MVGIKPFNRLVFWELAVRESQESALILVQE